MRLMNLPPVPVHTADWVLAQETRPAGGAALDQILIATGGATVLTLALLISGYRHRTGRSQLLTRLARFAQRLPVGKGLPTWAALPVGLGALSLITALLGMYWDISLHITHGRDEGPLANIAHYPILIGLFGVFTTGTLAMVLPGTGEKPGGAAVRITRDWYAPVGGVVTAGAGLYALVGFPLDDVWHRMFGQDVTLWGPTHLMLIGGAGLSLVGLALLEREGRQAQDEPDPSPVVTYARRGGLMGAFLIGLSVFQAEYDFGVEQFRMVQQPFMIAVAAACALVAARLWVGRGGAVYAVGFYMLIRGGVAVVVSQVIGELWASVPMYFIEAVIVELVALVLVRRALAFGVVSGVLIGTVGFLGEYAWTQVAFVLPWGPDILAEGVPMALAGAVPGGVLGALLYLAMEGKLPRPRVTYSLYYASLVVIALAITNGLIGTAPPGIRANVALTDVSDGAGNAVVRMEPAGVETGAAWLQVTGWQGGEGLYVNHLRPVGDGTYRTTEPMPLHGRWKTVIRLHHGRAQVAVPVYLPADQALNLPQVSAAPQFTREAQPEWQVLQRETKHGIPSWLWLAASLVVLVCSITLVMSIAWGAQRVNRAVSGPGPDVRPAGARRLRLSGSGDVVGGTT